MFEFIGGLALGAIIGFLTCALLIASKEDE